MDRIPINKYPYTDFHELNLDWVIERIQEMYTIIDTKITEALAPINAQITDINADLTSIHGDLNDFEERMNHAEGDITALYNNITIINDRITPIENTVSGLNETVTDIGARLTSVEDKNTTQDAEIADIYDKLADIDPDSSLIVDATNFDTEEKTVSILEDILKFELTGGDKTDIYYLQPDLIPNTQSGYYPRVTMTFNPTTDKVELPSELTTGDHPLILRGTYATNVSKDAEIYVNDPLEYHIDGKRFIIDGSDENAIILMCLWSMHHSDNIENIYNDNNVNVLHGIPVYKLNDDYVFGPLYQNSVHVSDLGINEYIYCFDKAGNLLSYGLIGDDAQVDYVSIPNNTYSIWVGINVPNYTEKDINTLSFRHNANGAGAYMLTNEGYITMHVVDFLTSSSLIRYTATYNDIKGLVSTDKIDMLTGKVYRGSYNIYNCTVNGSLNNLHPETAYTPTLTFKDTGYLDADLKYNKVSLLINGLDANNTRY